MSTKGGIHMAKREYNEARARANHKYDSAHYWKPTLYIPKELEQSIREKSEGSISGYIVGLVKKDLGIENESKKGTP